MTDAFIPTPQIPTTVSGRLALRARTLDALSATRMLFNLLPSLSDAAERAEALDLVADAANRLAKLLTLAEEPAAQAWEDLHTGT